MGKYWHPEKNLSTWRKISTGMWRPPADPTVYGHDTLDMTDALQYLEEVSQVSGVNVTVTALLVKTFATILHENPDLNVMIVNGKIQRRKSVDIFCQVMIPREDHTGGADLSGVKLVDVPSMDIVEISERLHSRASKLRKGEDEEMEQTKKTINSVPPCLMRWMLKISDFLTYNVPFDLSAIGLRDDPFGSIMISSISQFGIRHGYAPLVPASRCPMVIIPGVVHDVPMVVDGEVVPRKGVTFGGTFDHRLYDGYQIGLITRMFHSHMQHPRDYYPTPEYWAKKSEKKQLSEEVREVVGESVVQVENDPTATESAGVKPVGKVVDPTPPAAAKEEKASQERATQEKAVKREARKKGSQK